jgi:hypothetical protein
METPDNWSLSEGVKERQKFRRWPPACGGPPAQPSALPKRLKHLSFHLEIRVEVSACRCDACVAKVVTDYTYVDAGLG